MQRHLICIRQLPGSLEKCSTSEWKEGPRMLYHFKTGFNICYCQHFWLLMKINASSYERLSMERVEMCHRREK